MECKQHSELERAYLDARKQSLQAAVAGKAAAEQIEKLTRAELEALLAIVEHQLQHACRMEALRKLPASRNIGGIIGPY